MRRFKLIFIAIFVVIAEVAQASSPKIIVYRSQRDFEKGELTGVSIDHIGQLRLSLESSVLFEPEFSFVWDVTSDNHGNIYFAGGNGGHIYRLDPGGNAQLIFEASEVGIFALAVNSNGDLFAASSPEGKLYKLSKGKKSAPENAVFFDPDEIYIWSLAVDIAGNLYVATGEQGNIYKVTPGGLSALFYESGDTHVRTLMFDHDGNLIAGTSGNAHILRIDTKGRAFVLYDSPLVEISSLAIDAQGIIYAAAAGAARIPAAPASKNAPHEREQNGDELSQEGVDLQIQSGSSRGRAANRNSALYRIEKDGTVLKFWQDRSEQIYSLLPGKSQNVLIGTGPTGRLYSMTPTGEYTLMMELEEMELTSLHESRNDKVYVSTSNGGKLYMLDRERITHGEFLSDVVDAKVSSSWGAISWDAEQSGATQVRLFTRSGNTEEPDKTWSDWSKGYTVANGENITSPSARFLQFKAELISENRKQTPVLKEVSFSYLQRNTPPRIETVTIHPSGDYYPKSASHAATNSNAGNGANSNGSYQNQSMGRKGFNKGFRSVSWQAKDDNGDVLSHDVYYRAEDEENWKPLVEDYSGSVYSWDSELFPDGRFFIKVSANDEPSNPPGVALHSAKISQPFIVDNTGPQVSNITTRTRNGHTLVTFSVEDKWSIITSVHYGVNAEKWALVYPVDGICDSRRETFTVQLEDAVQGSNTIVIKAQDAIKNLGFGKTSFKF